MKKKYGLDFCLNLVNLLNLTVGPASLTFSVMIYKLKLLLKTCIAVALISTGNTIGTS